MVFHRRVDFVIMVAVGTIVLSGLSGCGAKEEPEDTTPKPYTCTGAPATCLRIAGGWTYEGVVLSMSQTGNGGPDPVVIRLDDGRYRIYYAVADTPGDPDWWGLVSWISEDGLNFTKEAGYRFEGYTLFGHWIVRNPDGSFRMYWLDQKQGQVDNKGYKAIKSALSTDGGWTLEGSARWKAVGLAGVTPVIDALGATHMFLWGTRCTGNYVNSRAGLFDGATADGLTLTIDASPFVGGYSKDGTLSTVVGPQDHTVVQTPQGLRVYFILYGPNGIVTETALYSVINTSIK